MIIPTPKAKKGTKYAHGCLKIYTTNVMCLGVGPKSAGLGFRHCMALQ